MTDDTSSDAPETGAVTYNHGPGSFAHNNRDVLPGQDNSLDQGQSLQAREQFDNARDPLIPIQKAEMNLSEAERRENFMVKRQAPQHIMRPSKEMALGPDRAAFNKQWHDEQMRTQHSIKKFEEQEINQPLYQPQAKSKSDQSLSENAKEKFMDERRSPANDNTHHRKR